LAQSSRDGTWGIYKIQSKHPKIKLLHRTGTKRHKESKPIPSYSTQVRGEMGEVPVSWFTYNISCCKFANLPNSAGTGPGGYKTQSIHTKNKSPYPNGMILVRNASQCLNTEGKSGEEGWSTGKLVLIQQQPSQFRQLAQISRDGTWDIQNPVKTYKKQVTLSYLYDLTEERKPMP
jgi:hypothetical protein